MSDVPILTIYRVMKKDGKIQFLFDSTNRDPFLRTVIIRHFDQNVQESAKKVIHDANFVPVKKKKKWSCSSSKC